MVILSAKLLLSEKRTELRDTSKTLPHDLLLNASGSLLFLHLPVHKEPERIAEHHIKHDLHNKGKD